MILKGRVPVLENGQIIFEHSQGKADLGTNTPFTPHTTITLASLSKQFVAVAVAMSDVFMCFGLKYTHINGRIAYASGYVKHNDEIFSCGFRTSSNRF